MIKKPNVFQKLIHLIAMQRPVSAFFASRMHRIDGMVLKMTNGRRSLAEFLGWPILQLTTTGAKTGNLHTLPLFFVLDCEKIALIASSFGRRHNPGWYYNLKKIPDCDVHREGISGKYIAREAGGEERKKYWNMAVSYYLGYENYRKQASHRQIPVMILEPAR